MDAILELQDVNTYIGQFHILEGVSLSVPGGAVTVILGRNGAGKTTTLRTIMGLTPPRTGRVVLAGQEVQGKAPYDIAKLGIGYVPEHRGIFADLSVEENLKLAERKKGDLERKADLIFDLFPDLKRLIKLGGRNLSGGQQQMLAVARALVPDNKLLLIDEPTKGLAPVVVEAVMEAIHQLRKTLTVLLVEQNYFVASGVGEYYTIIDVGKTVSAGEMAELRRHPEIVERYLGAT
ncbi:MAG: ABC transporter ATP-binding protein [Chloroflexi bacterium]|nr:ABC transporter ATP-binding protein [Chloroflexota bacterium]MBU1747531.1 ABC transporter ATP-binding protein [Chloroflexota bacterium]MBU1877751.1 ABC transporter ATP-binding protein [Chloroflexota bacterium]